MKKIINKQKWSRNGNAGRNINQGEIVKGERKETLRGEKQTTSIKSKGKSYY